jgi:hypothetical protein
VPLSLTIAGFSNQDSASTLVGGGGGMNKLGWLLVKI